MKREAVLEFSPEEEDIVAKMFRLVGKRLIMSYTTVYLIFVLIYIYSVYEIKLIDRILFIPLN